MAENNEDDCDFTSDSDAVLEAQAMLDRAAEILELEAGRTKHASNLLKRWQQSRTERNQARTAKATESRVEKGKNKQ